MTFKQNLARIFGGVAVWLGAVEREVTHSAESIVHQAEKEVTMSIPQNISDALAKISAILAGKDSQSAADAQTISGLQGQVTTLTGQVNDLTAAGQQKDAQIADLTSQLADAQGQLSDIENAVLGLVPASA